MTGILQPSEGTLLLDGRPVTLSSAHDAFARGITAIHQETVLFDDLTVAENIFLGHAPRNRWGGIDWRTTARQAREALSKIGVGHLDVDARLRDLGMASKHLVAVARALSVDARVVIMDEPTAALSVKEVKELFRIVELLKRDGKAILFISHKLEEIERIADRYVVFRDGEMVGEGWLKDTSRNEIIRMMVGRSIDRIFPTRRHTMGRQHRPAPGCRTRPNSKTSASNCARAKFWASTALSALAEARSCRRSLESRGQAAAR